MINYYLFRCELSICASYDRHLHTTQLDECLSRWRNAFNNVIQSSSSLIICVYLLRNVHHNDILQQCIELKIHISDRYMQIRQIIDAIKCSNYYRLFKLLPKLSPQLLR
jgi:hypothetical protein